MFTLWVYIVVYPFVCGCLKLLHVLINVLLVFLLFPHSPNFKIAFITFSNVDNSQVVLPLTRTADQ